MWPFGKTESFAVETQDGTLVFFEANRYWVDRDGRLQFKVSWFRRVGTVEKGEWVRVQAGLSERDFEA
jgi:hypothetical protein